MATLISQTTSNGGTRRCDAKCYDGHGHKCKCICGGINHGKGLKKAMENTREIAIELLKQTDTKIAKEIIESGDIILRRMPDGTATANVPHAIVDHSPTGFEWGYGGSGPADLALNILLLFTDRKTAWALHQDFKWQFIATMPHEGGIIKREDILNWLREQHEAVRHPELAQGARDGMR